MARVTLQTIADHVGVSRMTVSNAFSRPDQLSAELRERILAAAEELGYAGPDPAARALARGRSGVVGILLTNSPRDAFTDDVAVGFVRAVAGPLADAGYSMVLLHSAPVGGSDPAREVAMDGAIIYSCTPRTGAVTALRERRLPIVNVESAPIPGIPRITIANTAGAYEAAKHLVDLGHRDIALVALSVDADDEPASTTPLDATTTTIAERMHGWMSALEGAGIDPRIVGAPGVAIDDTLRTRIGRMLDDPPTAVLAFSDLAAMEVIDQAKARGIRVPEDLSVVGFDDSPLAARVTPPLTTVRQDIDAKGEAAAEALLTLMRSEPAPPVQELGTALIVRASTSPPSHARAS